MKSEAVMKKMLKIIKWTAITVVAAFVVASAYVGMNSFDCEPPDISRFINPMKRKERQART